MNFWYSVLHEILNKKYQWDDCLTSIVFSKQWLSFSQYFIECEGGRQSSNRKPLHNTARQKKCLELEMRPIISYGFWPADYEYPDWAEVCEIWWDKFFIFIFVVWSSRQSKICRIVIFDQKTCFTTKKKKFWTLTKQVIYGETRQITSETKTETYLKTSGFYCSHIMLHLTKYKLKLEFAERNQN